MFSNSSTGFAAGHFEHVGDRAAAVLHVERFAVVAVAAAGVAVDPHVGQEVHLDAQLAGAFAVVAAAAGDVEAEPAGRVAAELRLGELGEQLADEVEDAGVGGGVRRGRVAQRALVDADDLVDLLDAVDGVVGAGDGAGAVELAGELVVEHVLDERALAAAGDAGDGGERAEGDGRR